MPFLAVAFIHQTVNGNNCLVHQPGAIIEFSIDLLQTKNGYVNTGRSIWINHTEDDASNMVYLTDSDMQIPKRSFYIWLFSLLTFVLVNILLISFCRMRKKRLITKERYNMVLLQDMKEGYEEQNEILHKVLLQRFHLMKRALLYERYLKEEEKKQSKRLIKKFNEIIYGQETLDWNVLYQSINDLHDGALDRMAALFARYHSLDETDFRISLLSYAGFDQTEISIVLDLTTSTIQARRTNIRKQLGIERLGNINVFLKQKIEYHDPYVNYDKNKKDI